MVDARDAAVLEKIHTLRRIVAADPCPACGATGLFARGKLSGRRLIPLNPTALEALVRWASRRPSADPKHYIFPWCENRQVDPTRPTKGWRTAWRNALKRAGFKCRFHDLRHTTTTKLAEGQASDPTIMSMAGHVSKEMMERYSHIRTEAKRRALDAIAQAPAPSVLDDAVHQNVHQIEEGDSDASRKPLN